MPNEITTKALNVSDPYLSPQAFFTETTYQKSILESKNKVFQKISGTKSKLKNVDFSPADDLMNSANEKFQVRLSPFMIVDYLLP